MTTGGTRQETGDGRDAKAWPLLSVIICFVVWQGIAMSWDVMPFYCGRFDGCQGGAVLLTLLAGCSPFADAQWQAEKLPSPQWSR